MLKRRNRLSRGCLRSAPSAKQNRVFLSQKHRLHRFISLVPEDRDLLARAVLSLAAWRIGVWLFPIRALLQHGRRAPSLAPLPVEKVTWGIELAARFVPGATCLIQALAAQSLLTRMGHRSQLKLGVSKKCPGREFDAHAWVQSGDCIVIGGTDLDRYTPLFAWEEPF
jgi:hypothetical protein